MEAEWNRRCCWQCAQMGSFERKGLTVEVGTARVDSGCEAGAEARVEASGSREDAKAKA